MSWCELHSHSYHSLLDGARSPEALASRAAALGYPALALTDHNSLGGIVDHARACEAAGIIPIAGVELTLVDGSHLTLLVRDDAGYRSLCRIVSDAQLRGEKGAPVADLTDLAASTAGLECLSGCRKGRVARALGLGDGHGARRALADLRDIFGADHTWVEVQIAGLADDRILAQGLHRLARQEGLGLVATGNSHYSVRADRRVQDVLTCIRERVPLAQARPYLRSGASWHLRSPCAGRKAYPALPTQTTTRRLQSGMKSTAQHRVWMPHFQPSAGLLRHCTAIARSATAKGPSLTATLEVGHVVLGRRPASFST